MIINNYTKKSFTTTIHLTENYKNFLVYKLKLLLYLGLKKYFLFIYIKIYNKNL